MGSSTGLPVGAAVAISVGGVAVALCLLIILRCTRLGRWRRAVLSEPTKAAWRRAQQAAPPAVASAADPVSVNPLFVERSVAGASFPWNRY